MTRGHLVSACVFALLLSPAALRANAFPVVTVYHDWTVSYRSWTVGVVETDRIERREFGPKVVPGRMVTIQAGPPRFTWELPCPLYAFMSLVGMAVLFALAALARHRNGARCKTSPYQDLAPDPHRR